MTGKTEYHFKLKDTLSKGLTMKADDFISVTIGKSSIRKKVNMKLN